METSTTTNYTFKLLLGEEIRRLTVTRPTTSFPQFLKTLRQLFQDRLPATPRLTWTDDEGDVITLRTQQDLEEALTFLDNAPTKTLKITVSAEESPKAAAAPSSPSSSTSAADSSSTSASSSEEPAASTPEEASFKRGGRWGRGRGRGGRGWQRHHQEGEEKGKGKGQEGWHARHAERLSSKLESKEERFNRKLEKLKQSPNFDAQEFQRQVGVLREAGVEVLPLAEVLIARNIIHSKNRKEEGGAGRRWQEEGAEAGAGEGEQGRRGGRGGCWEKKKLEMLSEQTRKQLEVFRGQGLPSGPIMGLYLELKGNYAGEGLEAEAF